MISLRHSQFCTSIILFASLCASFACSSAEKSGGDGDGDEGAGTGGVPGATGGISGDGDVGSGGTPGDGDGADPSVSAFVCPSGSGAMIVDDISTKTPTPVTVPAPAADTWFLEGPVWIGTALFVSQIRDYGPLNPAHILKYTPGGAFETFVSDTGTNGLAVNGAGQIVAASHAVGGIVTYDPTSAAAPGTTVVDGYNGSRFNSPNDLTIRSDGTIYFTDPDWQCQGCGHQPVEGVYRVPPGGTPELITATQSKPNGIALSPDESTLYIGGDVLTSHPVMADGSVGAGTNFGSGGSDGLAIDCAGNVYATQNDGQVAVFDSTGASVGTLAVQGARNVAFGGPNATTLFVVGTGASQGGMMQTIEMNVPGYPY